MGRAVAWLFDHLQAAPFYRKAHAAAVATLPYGRGQHWIDIGCGPGLVARLAAARDYRVTAYDLDPAMLAVARHHVHAATVSGGFQHSDLATLVAAGCRADVVSAASLLAVFEDRAQALRDLLACVAPGGTLLLIETTARMRPGMALRWLFKHGWREGGGWLLLWAWVRRGRVIIDDASLAELGGTVRYHEVLEGLLGVWLIKPAKTEN